MNTIVEEYIYLVRIDPMNILVPFAFTSVDDAKHFVHNHPWMRRMCQDFKTVSEFEIDYIKLGNEKNPTFVDKVNLLKKKIPELQVYVPTNLLA